MEGHRSSVRFRYLLALSFILFCVYLMTLCPQIYWRDAPEFVATSSTLSFSHPAGSPTYNLAAKTMTFLPLGSIAFRVNLFSALCGILTALLLFIAIEELFRVVFGRAPDNIEYVGISFCILLFCFSHYYWKMSITAEVYTFQDCFILLVLWMGLNFYRTKDIRFFWISSMIFGLGLGAHIANILLLPPLALLFLTRKAAWKQLGIAVFFFLLGSSIYLLLPFRFDNAPIRLGYWNNDVISTLNHIRGKITMPHVEEEVIKVLSTEKTMLPQVWSFIRTFTAEISIMGVGLGLLGATVLLLKRPLLMGVLGLAFAFYAAFFSGWSAMGLFPNFIFLVILMSIGVKALLDITKPLNQVGTIMDTRPVWLVLRAVLILGLVVQAGILFIRNFDKNNLEDFYTSRDVGAFTLDQLPVDAKIIPRYSNPQFQFFYLQGVEGYRKDVGVSNYDIFLNDNMMRSFIVKELKQDFRVFWTGNPKTERFVERLVPYGTVFEFTKGPVDLNKENLKRHLYLRSLLEKRLSSDPYELTDYSTYEELYKINTELFRYYDLKKRYDLAEWEYEALRKVNPESPLINQFYIISLFEGEQPMQKAADEFQAYMNKIKDKQGIIYENLFKDLVYAAGAGAMRRGYYDFAEQVYRERLYLYPKSGYYRYLLATALLAQGKYEEAYQQAQIAYDRMPTEESETLLEQTKKALSQNKSPSKP